VIILAVIVPAAALLLLLGMDRLEARLLQPPGPTTDRPGPAVTPGTPHQQAGRQIFRIQTPVILARLSVEGPVHPERHASSGRASNTPKADHRASEAAGKVRAGVRAASGIDSAP
jgi:hypothetical protein